MGTAVLLGTVNAASICFDCIEMGVLDRMVDMLRIRCGGEILLRIFCFFVMHGVVLNAPI